MELACLFWASCSGSLLGSHSDSSVVFMPLAGYMFLAKQKNDLRLDVLRLNH